MLDICISGQNFSLGCCVRLFSIMKSWTVMLKNDKSLMKRSERTQPVDDVSAQETRGSKHGGSDPAGRRASSLPFGDDGMVQLPLLRCGDACSCRRSLTAAACQQQQKTNHQSAQRFCTNTIWYNAKIYEMQQRHVFISVNAPNPFLLADAEAFGLNLQVYFSKD